MGSQWQELTQSRDLAIRLQDLLPSSAVVISGRCFSVSFVLQDEEADQGAVNRSILFGLSGFSFLTVVLEWPDS